jgi:thiol-disulfide isomerase/thioredoxin
MITMPGIVNRPRRWLIFGVVGVLALAIGAFVGLRPEAPQDASTLLALSLPDITGQQQPLGQWRGKVVVVNFWATWCAPCREEMPEFVRAQSEFGPKGLQFVGIAVDQADKVDEFARELRLNYPVLIGGYGAIELSKTLGNRLMALPFTIIVDRQGRVAHTQLGPLKPDQLRSIVSKLLPNDSKNS